ncbi:MAG: hypothetical protein R3E39_22745 [Anaerolineae bacterium]
MEALREMVPLMFGAIVLPPLLTYLMRQNWSGRIKFLIVFLASLIVGFVASTVVGEQHGELEEAVVALVIDTSLAYTGSQVAYWLFWKPVMEIRSRTTTKLSH